jgi:cytochrome c
VVSDLFGKGGEQMRKIVVLVLLAVMAGSVAIGYAQEEKEENAKMDPAAELAKSVERGFGLFNDKKLGTSGKTCNDCHMSGGAQVSKMGDMTMKAFDNLAAQYPKFFMMGEKIMTLDQVVNFCIMTPLKGEPLAWDDQRLTDLVAYCASVKPAKIQKKQ